MKDTMAVAEMWSNMYTYTLNNDEQKLLQEIEKAETLQEQLYQKYGEYHWNYMVLSR